MAMRPEISNQPKLTNNYYSVYGKLTNSKRRTTRHCDKERCMHGIGSMWESCLLQHQKLKLAPYVICGSHSLFIFHLWDQMLHPHTGTLSGLSGHCHLIS